LTISHCDFSAELTKMHSFGMFFGNFSHWAVDFSLISQTMLFLMGK